MRYNIPRTLTAMLAIATEAHAHLTMVNPKPFRPKEDNLDRDPLRRGQFPCRPEGDIAAWYDRSNASANTMAVGETQTLSFSGSAIHGGGSCQLALTTDLQPTVSSSWLVILSIEGGCPVKSGDGSPSTYDFKIPEGIVPGEYVFAWTWISRLAGQREYYMNCAPLTVTAGTGGGSGGGASGAAASPGPIQARQAASPFPELFVANLADVNDCRTGESADVEFPNPGPNRIRPNPNSVFLPVTGSDLTKCTPKVAAKPSGMVPSPAPVPSSVPIPPPAGGTFVTTSSPATSSSPTAATSSTRVNGDGDDYSTATDASSSTAAAPAEVSSSSSSPSSSFTLGSTFITEPPSSTSAAATPTATAAPSASASAPDYPGLTSSAGGMDPTVVLPSAPCSTTQPAATSAPPTTTRTTFLTVTKPSSSSSSSSYSAAPSASGVVGGGSGGALLTGPCTPEGMYNCDGASF
ncbi:hypothetical protein Micbo1qcDRAFT_217333 [Microdochium bolleyi]|uniref:Lytic polysaccharide monooxygenase n=1 Tax=Microdochium bolleyi TaxID=196109 RepID=A0A136JEP4_9PEZI|nr:hypothetical protein Micbo1qcDRAFT_217333 [Microdochium bolleyi]